MFLIIEGVGDVERHEEREGEKEAQGSYKLAERSSNQDGLWSSKSVRQGWKDFPPRKCTLMQPNAIRSDAF